MHLRVLFRSWFISLAGVGLAAMAHAGLVASPVFISGADGYNTYRIPAIVVTTNGTVLAFCEGRKHGSGDSGKIDLLLKRSADGGETWGAQQVIWSDGENTCGNPAPVVDQTTGFIWLLMSWNLGTDKQDKIGRGASDNTRRVFVTHSADNGLNWAPPVEITKAVKKPDWQWYATGPANGIQLALGLHPSRLVIPANHSELSDQGQPVSRAHIIFSDDHGASWQLGGTEAEKTDESTVVERADGSLLHNMRSYQKRNRRAVAASSDGGMTWSPVKLDEALIEPVCEGSLLRCTWPANGEKSRILFSNPASLKREKLTVRVSYDEGATWPASRLIYAGPAAYSCLAILPNKTIACLFECGTKNSHETITLARFPLNWLEEPGTPP